MNYKFEKNWATNNNGYNLHDSEVERYLSVVPDNRQLKHLSKPFYAFIHFGMNTATAREWGSGEETPKDFTIKEINAKQWVSAIKAGGATGIILTCKHHDGFCLWNSEYTDFSVKNSDFDGDIVDMVSKECARQNMDFGVYLSPWDMHDERYGTDAYNDYFCNQLTELLTNYGNIFEVWFDGAKGSNAVDFEYDWDRYFELIRRLQPDANIAICGPDIRWIGNEGGKTRKSEYSVVPECLRRAESTMKNSQQSENQASSLKRIGSKDEDLGSRKVLEKNANLCFYPAEVDVSIRKGWFYSKDENKTVKSAGRLFRIYLNSVGRNSTLLLNIPPSDKGVIHSRDVRALKRLGKKINSITSDLILKSKIGMLSKEKPVLDFNFDSERKLKWIVLKEDLSHSQRVEAFELYIRKSDGKYKRVYKGTVIGSQCIIKMNSRKAVGARLVIKQSRSVPVLDTAEFYE